MLSGSSSRQNREEFAVVAKGSSTTSIPTNSPYHPSPGSAISCCRFSVSHSCPCCKVSLLGCWELTMWTPGCTARCKGWDPHVAYACWVNSLQFFIFFFHRGDVRALRFHFLTAPGLEKWNPAGKEKPFMNFKRWDTLCTEAHSLHWLWKEDNPRRLTKRLSLATCRNTVVYQGNLELVIKCCKHH